ncbi:MAG: hypothetical protein WCJ84_04735 [Candidatus Peregrinibacteria bacterium]
MDIRKRHILQAIIQQFIHTASPVGSKLLKEIGGFEVSSATLRSDMSTLEDEGFLMQVHTSGGRIPTPKGYRLYVDEMAIPQDFRLQIFSAFEQQCQQYFEEKRADELVFDAVSVMTRMTPNIVFSTIPSANRMFFLGFSRMMQEPEFYESSEKTSGIFRVLEEQLYGFLHSLDIGDGVEIFIGEENVIPEMESCSLLVSRYSALNYQGYFGILGPMRMDYTQNMVVLEAAKKLFR